LQSEWWDWEIELTPHSESRLEERVSAKSIFGRCSISARGQSSAIQSPAGTESSGGRIMSAFTVQITYRRGKPLATCIYLASRKGQKSVRTQEFRPNLLVDFSRDGSPLGIEVLSLKLSSDNLYAGFDHLGLNRPDLKDLQPILEAA
jgi:hypothetical protein